MVKRIILLLCFILIMLSGYSRSCQSTGNGNWDNTTSWSCSGGPGAGDTIIIQSSHTITVSNIFSISGAPILLQVEGTLNFQTGKKMTLPAGSEIELNGWITAGGGGGTSNLITIGNTDVWKAGDGDIQGPRKINESCPALTGCPLPLTLLNFDVKYTNNQIYLSWTTVDEIDFDYFTIQRSYNLTIWEDIAIIKGSGGLNKTNYSYTDQIERYGVSYYRLKETDINGTTTYFEVRSINVKNDNIIFEVFPNPITEDVFTINNNIAGEVIIYNNQGKLVFKDHFKAEKNIIKLDLVPGAYTLSFVTDTERKTVLLLFQ